MATRRRAQIGKPKSARRVTTREFARSVGVSQPDVVKAMRTGRLKGSVRRDAAGRSYIADRELALREWRERATPRVAPPALPPQSDEQPPRPTTKADADLLVTLERERKLRLENDAREGRLIEATRVRRDSYETARTVRDSMLNIPDRVAAELAAEGDATKVHARLDAEIRAALVALAELLDAEPAATGDGDGA
jgi:hypothetical protein